jgi:uncharacterized membrane protein
MNWLFASLLAPLFWSVSNHIDKFLLDKHFKGIGKEALILYSTLFGIVVFPVAYLFDHNIFSIGFISIIILIIGGCLGSLAIYFYLFALEEEETSIVVPFMQITPIFGFILGFFLLKEVLSFGQIIGSIIVVLGAFILSLEISELEKIKFKKRIAWLMVLSSFAFALYEILFKFVAIEGGFWVATFWEYVGLFAFGLFIFLSSRKHRTDFLFLIKRHNWKLFSTNITSESITIIGNMFANFALLLAPAALVMTVAGYQPIFVLLGSIILTVMFPKIVKENISFKHLLHKTLAILVVFLGTFVMYNY